MNFWLPNINAGLGDYLMLASLLSALARARPAEAVGVRFEPCAHDFPLRRCVGVFAEEGAQLPGSEDLWETCARFQHAYPETYARFGLSWRNKRLRYRLSNAEKLVALASWGPPEPARLRCLLQWHGGHPRKRYAEMPVAFAALAARHRVLVLDERRESGLEERCLVPPCSSEQALAFAGTADLFVGFDSGPLFAALGCGVPSVALWTFGRPERVAFPVAAPRFCAFATVENPNEVSLEELLDAAEDVLR